MYALVLVEYSVKKLDKCFTYRIPAHLQDILKVGMKVKVDFNNRKTNGFILNITDTCDTDFELKEIAEVVDPEIILNDELIEIAKFLTETTLCSQISAFQTMLPASLKVKEQKSNYNAYDKYLVSNISHEEIEVLLNSKISDGQKLILEDLLYKEKILKKEYSLSSIKTLIAKGYIKEEAIQKYRLNAGLREYKPKTLTAEQQQAFNQIISGINTSKTYLLHGITGSGKTEVYIKLIESVLKNNKTAILLVPEISLTAQMTARFYDCFGDDVAIFHSGLSTGEKHDEYLKIIREEVHVVIGTRSAIFAPLKNLGIIIIDEEHSSTYKQDNNPKYNAKDVAKKRCEINNIPLVLGSATPTLESKARADKKVFELVKLTKRVGKAILPQIHIVDMEAEMKKRNMIFSDLLIAKINNRLEKGEQVILLLNRRGHSTFVNCKNCGYVYKCPKCDISMTYHKTNNNLICHYCGYLLKKKEVCPKCNEESLNFLGLGTEKLEEQLHTLFPDAKIVRMDQDTTTKKGSHEKIIKDFMDEKYDILLGTQMISKGLDFPKVSLVGVINADISLNIPDFRSNETTYSLLSQVAGRAGRSDILGEVIIQTFNPDNYVINCVKNNDYESFYLSEMKIRNALKYPPYYYLVSLRVVGKNYEETLEEAKKVGQYVKNNVEDKTIVLGPTTAAVFKFNNEYRFQLIIKYQFDKLLMHTLKDIDNMFISKKNMRIEIDINPSRI